MMAVRNATVFIDPFPHMVIDNLVTYETYKQLLPLYPMHKDYVSAKEMLGGEETIWRDYIAALNTVEFHQLCLQKFGSHIVLTRDNTGLRKVDDKTPYVTESYTIIRYPSEEWVLKPHIDSEYARISSVHMFKDFSDTGTGGEYCTLVRNSDALRVVSDNNVIDYAEPDGFTIAKKVPYSPNAAVIMFKTSTQWHGIMPSSYAKRRTVNFSLETQNSGIRKK